MFDDLAPVIGVIGLALIVLLLAVAIAKRYKVAKPNEAFVITGRKGKTADGKVGEKVVTAGGVFVVPFIQQLQTIDLSSRRINVRVDGAPSGQGIPLNVAGVAAVKINQDAESIRAAAQRFGSQQTEIDNFATDQLAGALRSIVGTLTVEELIRNRTRFAQEVTDAVTSTLASQGLHLDSFTIQEVSDHGAGSYIADMGRPSAAEIRRQAEVAEAENRRQSEQERIAAETEVANYQRALALRKAEIQAETDRAAALAAAAGPLEDAAQQQQILTQHELVAERRAAVTEKELDTTVRRPADAARYQAAQEAEADKVRIVLAAQAAREEATQRAAGELELRTSEARAIELEGAARASATRAQGLAEAEALDKRAEAYQQFNQAAVLSLVTEVLPQVASELARPMSSIDQLTVVSTDGAGALPKAVAGNLAQLLEVLKSVSGLDLAALVGSFPGNGVAAGRAAAAPVAAPVATVPVAVAPVTAAPAAGAAPAAADDGA